MIEVVGMLTLVGAAVAFGAFPSSPLDNCDPAGARAQSHRRAEVRGTMMLALGGITSGLALNACIDGDWFTGSIVVCLGFVAFLLLQPGPLVRAVLLPLGAWRFAMSASRWGGPPWLRDPEGGAVLMGVLALHQSGSTRESAITTLRAHLLTASLRGAGLVAAGLLADLEGDTTTARRILLSIDELDPDVCPPLARAIANDWLLEDAANRQRWAELDARSEHALTLSASGRLLHTVARRLLGRASRWDLFRAWLSAPRRWQTLGLVDQAWSDEVFEQYPIVDRDLTRRPANGFGLLGTSAASLHLDAVRAKSRGDLHPEVLQRLGLAWDETLWDLGVRRRVRGRSMQLENDATVEESVVEMHRELCVEIAALLPPSGDIPRDGKTMQRAIELFAAAQVHRIEVALANLSSADGATISPKAIDLWIDWLEVRDGYMLALRADPERASELFASIEGPLSHVVHWMWHNRGERPMANALATWIALEAERVENHESARYHRQYVAAGP